MGKDMSEALYREGVEALGRMEEALELIDQCDGTSKIGAHLDMAICVLRDLLAKDATKAGLF